MNYKLVHIYSWWQAEMTTFQRMEQAKKTWKEFYRNDKQGVMAAKFRLKKGQRSSLDIGESRLVPFIKDVINYGMFAYPDNINFLYTNADLSLVKDAAIFIRDSLAKNECGYSHRMDFEEKNYPKNPITRDELKNRLFLSSWSGGADSFFFTRNWWTKYEKSLPEALIGFEGWDFCIMATMLKTGLSQPTKWISYHQKHLAYWKEHRLEAPGQIYNRKVCSEWTIKNNLEYLINYGGGDFLFKMPTPYNVVV